MTQPPTGPGQWPEQPSPYPHQRLLPQQVQPGRSRLPLMVAAAVLVVVVIGVLVALRVVHDRGEHSRSAYCAALRTATQRNNLLQAVGGAPGEVPGILSKAHDLAPAAVASQWDDLFSIVAGGVSSQPSVAQVARVVTDLKAIVDDANANCGLKIQIP